MTTVSTLVMVAGLKTMGSVKKSDNVSVPTPPSIASPAVKRSHSNTNSSLPDPPIRVESPAPSAKLKAPSVSADPSKISVSPDARPAP